MKLYTQFRGDGTSELHQGQSTLGALKAQVVDLCAESHVPSHFQRDSVLPAFQGTVRPNCAPVGHASPEHQYLQFPLPH